MSFESHSRDWSPTPLSARDRSTSPISDVQKPMNQIDMNNFFFISKVGGRGKAPIDPGKTFEESQLRVVLLASELERLGTLNCNLVKEIETIKKAIPVLKSARERDLEAKIAVCLAENEKLNQILEEIMRSDKFKEQSERAKILELISSLKHWENSYGKLISKHSDPPKKLDESMASTQEMTVIIEEEKKKKAGHKRELTLTDDIADENKSTVQLAAYTSPINSTSQHEISAWKTAHDKLKEENQKLRKVAEEHKLNLEKYEYLLGKLSNVVSLDDNLGEKISQLIRELNYLKEENENLRNQNETLKGTVTNLSSPRKEKLDTSFEREQSTFDLKSPMRNLIEYKEQQIRQLRESIDELNIKIRMKDDEISCLKNKINLQSDEIIFSGENIKTKNNEIITLNQQIATLEIKLKENIISQNELNMSILKTRQLSAEIEVPKKVVDDNQVDSLKQKCERLLKKNKQLTEDVNKLNETLQSKNQENEAIHFEMQRIQAHLDVEIKQREQREARDLKYPAKDFDEENAKLTKALKKKTLECEQLQKRLVEVKNECNSLVKQLTDKIKYLASKNDTSMISN